MYWPQPIQGYAGIANFMGARFVTADPVITANHPRNTSAAQLSRRRIGAARRCARSGSEPERLPFARADFTIDAVPTSAEIDRRLPLESLARARNRRRRRLGAAYFDRADRRLDQDARKPWHHACTIDNRHAEIKIR